jgi:hypothetical protein
MGRSAIILAWTELKKDCPDERRTSMRRLANFTGDLSRPSSQAEPLAKKVKCRQSR